MVQIPTITQKKLFEDFLNQEDNNKIVLSAPFGSGKTTFLKDFFNKDVNKSSKAIFVYPVNYSVASNEDIFELIKYDILTQMLRWDNIESYITDLSEDWGVYKQFVNDPMKIIIPIVDAMGKLGGMVGQVANIGKGLFELKKELEKIAKESNEGDEIDRFMTEIESQTGSIYQKDIITIIIQSVLKRIKSSGDDISTILVIDDLDRIDPEHLFRILNILAAHNDIESEDANKFGFDKIITVFDIGNVKQIFCTKYGAKVDFIGYINKFYSKEVFYFDMISQICDKLLDVFAKTSIEGNDGESFMFWGSDTYKRVLPILVYLIQNKRIFIRDIKKINHEIKKNEDYAMRYMMQYNYLDNDMRWGPHEPYFIAYEFLSKLVGGRVELRNIIDELKAENYKTSLGQRINRNLDLKDIFSDYLNLCLNAEPVWQSVKSVKSDLLNCRIFYTSNGKCSFHVYGAVGSMVIAIKPNGEPEKYQFEPAQIMFNIWEVISMIVDKIEEKLYS